MKTLLEIVCCSAEDAARAASLGAGRIELCSAIGEGGLTPSLGAMVLAREACSASIVAMIRPREAGFCYSQMELATMECDAEAMLEAGADGLVFGCLTAEGRVDEDACGRLLEQAKSKERVFHRAFDVTPDPFEALEVLIDMGFTRVLTSGQQPTAIEGATLIKSLIERASGRIEILACGMIRPHNVRQVVDATGCTQIHMGAFREAVDKSGHANRAITFGTGDAADAYLTIDENAIQAVRAELGR